VAEAVQPEEQPLVEVTKADVSAAVEAQKQVEQEPPGVAEPFVEVAQVLEKEVQPEVEVLPEEVVVLE